jgi:hypothetical protein
MPERQRWDVPRTNARQETHAPFDVDAIIETAAGCIRMNKPGYACDRRSSRVFMRVRVVLSGKARNGRRFRKACETIVINAHGGLLYSSEELEKGALLVVTNPFTQEDQECRVVYLGDDTGKGQRVGLEFVTPAPHFWGIEFAQPDWLAETPAPAAQQT